MADFVIGACSTCDLPHEYVKQRDLKVMHYRFYMDGNDYIDGQDASISTKDFYDKVRAGSTSTTTMVDTESFEAFFRPVLECGKDMLYVCFSSGLSGTYHNACKVADKLNAEFPQRKVLIVDSRCAARGFGLFMHIILNKRDEGKSIDEIYEWAVSHAKNIIHWFAVDSLEHLRRGGRISRTSAFLGSVLNLKPVLRFDDEGKIVPVEKVRGRKQSLIHLVDKMEGQFLPEEDTAVFIGHGDALEDAQFVERLIRSRYPMVKDVFIHWIGPVIGTHSGPGTVALHYVGNKR